MRSQQYTYSVAQNRCEMAFASAFWVNEGIVYRIESWTFCSVLEFGPVPTSPTPLLQGAPVRLLRPVL